MMQAFSYIRDAGRAFLVKLGMAKPVAAGATQDLPLHASLRAHPHAATTLAQTRSPSVVDNKLIAVVAALLLWGLVMVYSATVALPDNPRFAHLSTTHFVLRQCISIGLAVVLALLLFRLPVVRWEAMAPFIFVFALLLLILVLLPFIGRGANGARRWLPLGFMTFQPSELAKLAVLLYAANYMVRKMDLKERFFKAVWPMVLALAVVGNLLLAEPDMGAFMVIAVVALGILYLGGIKARGFFLMVVVVVVAFVLMIYFSEWRRQRIFAYLDPWNEAYALGKGYQLTHSLIAFGRGKILGVGLGGSVEKLHWLPEAHTDFILAVIGEELGLLGVLAMGAAFMWLFHRMMMIGRKAIELDQVFAGLVAQGVGLWLGFQAFINMGVNLGALPTKGLTLPFISYGGSAILMNVVAVVLVLRIDYENRLRQRGIQPDTSSERASESRSEARPDTGGRNG